MELIEALLHLDVYIEMFIQNYGGLTYLILFSIIFLETGIVFVPFLPGDSIIFAAAAFAARGSMDIFVLVVMLIVAAIIGDTCNYIIGKKFGIRLSKSRFIKKEHLKKANDFYEKYGNKAITIARFVPIVRTIVPFTAGIGNMNYKRFIEYNVFGAVIWVGLMSILGFFFGNIPIVKDNFGFITIGIILISTLPILIEFIKYRSEQKEQF